MQENIGVSKWLIAERRNIQNYLSNKINTHRYLQDGVGTTTEIVEKNLGKTFEITTHSSIPPRFGTNVIILKRIGTQLMWSPRLGQ